MTSCKKEVASDHVILNVKPVHMRVIRVLKEKNLGQIIKEQSKTLWQFSLVSESWVTLQKRQIQKASSSLKQLKCLTAFKFDLEWIANSHPSESIDRLLKPLKSMKRLSVLHFYSSKANISLDNLSVLALCKAINHTHCLRQTELRVLITKTNYSQQFCQLLGAFSQLERFTSINIIFSEYDTSQISSVIASLKNCKSLSKLCVTIDRCKFLKANSLTSIFGSLKEIKALKEARICFKRCNDITYFTLQASLQRAKEAAQAFNLDLRFVDCKYISVLGRKIFAYFLKKVTSVHTVNVKFTSRNSLCLEFWNLFSIPFCVFLLLLFLGIAVSIPLAPLIAVFATHANRDT